MSLEDRKRYEADAHAMQSGVAMDIEHSGISGAGADPKHLRVGVNSAMVEHSALVRLLIEKGVITLEEFERGLANAMQEEKERYEMKLAMELGKRVTLR